MVKRESAQRPNKQRKWSIRTHLYALVLAIALPLAALLAYTLYADYEARATAVSAASANLAQTGAAEAEKFLAETKALTARIAQRTAASQSAPENCDPIFNYVRDLNPRFANAGLINTNGDVICSAVPQQTGRAKVAQTEWFQRVMRENSAVLSKPFIGPITNKWVVVSAYPVREPNGATQYIIALPIDLSNILPSTLHANTKGISGAVVSIINEDGTIIARSSEPEQWVGKNIRDLPIVASTLKQNSAGKESVFTKACLQSKAPTSTTWQKFMAWHRCPARTGSS